MNTSTARMCSVIPWRTPDLDKHGAAIRERLGPEGQALAAAVEDRIRQPS